MTEVEVIAALAVENWKLQATLGRNAAEISDEKRNRMEAQLRYSRSQLDRLLSEADLKLITFDGEPFTAELPVSPINAEDLEGIAISFVAQTIEPTVVGRDSVVRVGRVLLRGD